MADPTTPLEERRPVKSGMLGWLSAKRMYRRRKKEIKAHEEAERAGKVIVDAKPTRSSRRQSVAASPASASGDRTQHAVPLRHVLLRYQFGHPMSSGLAHIPGHVPASS